VSVYSTIETEAKEFCLEVAMTTLQACSEQLAIVNKFCNRGNVLG